MALIPLPQPARTDHYGCGRIEIETEHGEAYWRERAEQLQHALSSRVVIEQSKGILSERLGVSLETAFELLRYAARGAQMKVHDLATKVVEGDGTPPELIQALARHRSVLEATGREERIVQTEVFFAAVNAEIGKLESSTEFICECGNPACTERLTLGPDALRTLHAEANRFVVLSGHEIPDVETVVDEADGYVIVSKDSPAARPQD